jgi:hypothetical protein
MVRLCLEIYQKDNLFTGMSYVIPSHFNYSHPVVNTK